MTTEQTADLQASLRTETDEARREAWEEARQ